MKPISEYNFREIVGKFVILQVDNPQAIDPNYDLFVAYCYIDMDVGISFKIYGGYTNNKIDTFSTKAITLRYFENIKLDLYELITDEMKEYSKNIENIYTPNWILSVREKTFLDEIRSKQFPDDILVPCRTIIDGKQVEELLWIRPTEIFDNYLIAKSIEDGKNILKGEEVAVFTIPNNNDFLIIAATNEWLELFNKNNN